MNFILVVSISVAIVVYLYFAFRIAAYLNEYFYEKGINVTEKMVWKYSWYTLTWPITIWFKKLWGFEK